MRYKRKILFLSSVIILFTLLLICAFLYTKTRSSRSANFVAYSKVFDNTLDGYSLKYPNTYKSEKSTVSGGTDLFLLKDDVWNDGGYNLDKGVSIIIHNNKRTRLSNDFLKQDNKDSFNAYKDGTITEKKLHGVSVFEVAYAYRHALGVPYTTRIYIQHSGDVLELSYTIGETISRKDYELYKKDFEAIIDNITFLRR